MTKELRLALEKSIVRILPKTFNQLDNHWSEQKEKLRLNKTFHKELRRALRKLLKENKVYYHNRIWYRKDQ